MNEITSLQSNTREELLEKLAYAVESLQNYEEDNENTEYLYQGIENTLYVLKNCDYEGKSNDQ